VRYGEQATCQEVVGVVVLVLISNLELLNCDVFIFARVNADFKTKMILTRDKKIKMKF
jgi:hypothetical protein